MEIVGKNALFAVSTPSKMKFRTCAESGFQVLNKGVQTDWLRLPLTGEPEAGPISQCHLGSGTALPPDVNMYMEGCIYSELNLKATEKNV